MTMAPNVQNFGDLSFDRMWQSNADKDRNTTLVIGVYRGRASMNIFSGQTGGPRLKLPLPKQHNVLFRTVFNHVRKTAPDSKITIPVTQWDQQEKKLKTIGHVTLGIDTTNMAYIGIQATGVEPVKFPIRSDLKWDLSVIPEINANQVALDGFLAEMDNVCNAMNLTSFKFEPSQRTAPYTKGNYTSGKQYSTAAPVSSSDIDDEIPF